MSTGGDELVERALGARAAAYAPYSGFRVGAAVRADDGRVFVGANVENASYGLSLCAERAAVLAAVNAGVRRIVEAAVASEVAPPAAPCGACRQTLHEFAAGGPLPITLASVDGSRVRTSLAELLPLAFGPGDLARPRGG